MRALATPLMDLVDEKPYAAVDAVHMDPTEPMPVRERSVAVDGLPATAVDALLATLEQRLLERIAGDAEPQPPSLVLLLDQAEELFNPDGAAEASTNRAALRLHT